ncbi:hypothetical protein D3C73_570730 [compost metagenome]
MEPLNRRWKLVLSTYLLLWFMGSLWLMGTLRSLDPVGKLLGIDLDIYRDYGCFGLAGAVGGSLYALRLFHEFYDKLSQRWLYWYFMRPFLCFGSAIITIILFDSGILLLEVKDSIAARISIAFLTGFGYGKFIEKIHHLTETFFNGKKKDEEDSSVK